MTGGSKMLASLMHPKIVKSKATFNGLPKASFWKLTHHTAYVLPAFF